MRNKISTLYDGIGGDVLCQGQWLNPQRLRLYEQGKLEDLVNLDLLPSDQALGLDQILTPQYYQRFSRDLAIDELVNELTTHDNAPNPISSSAFWNYARRGVALYSFSILSEIRNVFCPYLDHDVHDLLVSLPPSTFLDWTFHSEAIYKAFPKFNHIQFEKKQTDILRNSIRCFNASLLRELIGCGQPNMFRLAPAISAALRQMLKGGYPVQFAPYLLQLERLVQAGGTRN